MLLKIERWMARINMILEIYRNKSGQVYVEDRISEYREMWRAAAEKQGAAFLEVCEDIWEVELNGRRSRIKNDILEFDNPVTLDIAGRKPLIYRMLSEKGLPVPDYLVFHYDELERAGRFLQTHPLGCAVKPANGTSSGRGVTTHVTTTKELRKAAILASLYCREVLIEPMIAGECYRLLVLDGQVVHAVCRRGHRLTGDGRLSVSQLIREENERLKQNGKSALDIDRDCQFSLAYQGLTLEAVPEKDRDIIVKSVDTSSRDFREVRTVYNSVVTDAVCTDMIQKAREAAEVLRSRFVGVDFITADASKPLADTGGVINEVNTTPGLHHHYDSESEKFPAVAPMILEALLQN